QCIASIDKGTEGIFARYEPFWGLCAEGKRYRLPHTRAPPPRRGVATIKICPLRRRSRGCMRGAVGPGSRLSRHGARGLRCITDRLRDGAEQYYHRRTSKPISSVRK